MQLCAPVLCAPVPCAAILSAALLYPATSASAQTVAPPDDYSAQLPPLAPLVGADPAPSPLPPDAALAAPLPPINSIEPPPAMPATTDAALPQIRCRVTITGLKPIDLDDRHRGLSALLDKGRRAASASQVAARADADVRLAATLGGAFAAPTLAYRLSAN